MSSGLDGVSQQLGVRHHWAMCGLTGGSSQLKTPAVDPELL